MPPLTRAAAGSLCAVLVLAPLESAAALPFEPAVQARATAAIDGRVAPGIAIAVVRGGRTVYARGFGAANASGSAVDADTRFAIGSLTKGFTAAVTLMLARDGKLKLEDPLSAWVPQLPNARKIDLLQLLHQTSGLHNYPDTREHQWSLRGAIPTADILALLATDTSDFAPGTRWAYSNTNYTALAAVDERASGMTLGDLFLRRIFDPLEMKRSGYGFGAQTPDVAQPSIDGRWLGDADRISLDLFSGAGGAVSTASDMARWDIGLLDRTIADQREVALLWSPGALTDGSPTSYGMGFFPAQLNGRREVWANGYAPGAGGYCSNAIFPDDGIAVAVLTNSGSAAAEALAAALTRDVLEAYVPPVSARGEDPAVTERVRRMLASLRTGAIDRSQLTAAFNEALSPGTIDNVKGYFSALGEPAALLFTGSEHLGDVTKYTYRGTFPGAGVHDVYIFITAGKVAGFQVPP